MNKKAIGIVFLAIGVASIGGLIGFREALIMQDKTAPLMALKYMANLKKLEADECKHDYWSMYSEIDVAIGRYFASHDKLSLLGAFPKYSFLNETYAIKDLLAFRISQLQGKTPKTESEQAKLVWLNTLAAEID